MTISRRSLLLLSVLFAQNFVTSTPYSQSIQPYPLLDKKSSLAKGRFSSQANKSKTLDPRISEILTKIDGNRIWAHVQHLQEFGTRFSLSSSINSVAMWLSGKFVDMGYSRELVKLQEFTMPTGETLNNVLLLPEPSQKRFVLICAHFDSISEQSANLAPGADDNGSGVATLLELAQVFHSVVLQRGILIAAFNGEEQGLIGSQACAEIAATENWPIDLVINLDMVGFTSPLKPTNIVVEYDQGNVSPSNDASSKSFALQIAQTAADFTNLTVEHTNIWSSDYMPFEEKGFPCVGLYDEGGDHAFYHTSADTIGNVSQVRLVEIAKLMVASVVSICGLPPS